MGVVSVKILLESTFAPSNATDPGRKGPSIITMEALSETLRERDENKANQKSKLFASTLPNRLATTTTTVGSVDRGGGAKWVKTLGWIDSARYSIRKHDIGREIPSLVTLGAARAASVSSAQSLTGRVGSKGKEGTDADETWDLSGDALIQQSEQHLPQHQEQDQGEDQDEDQEEAQEENHEEDQEENQEEDQEEDQEKGQAKNQNKQQDQGRDQQRPQQQKHNQHQQLHQQLIRSSRLLAAGELAGRDPRDANKLMRKSSFFVQVEGGPQSPSRAIKRRNSDRGAALSYVRRSSAGSQGGRRSSHAIAVPPADTPEPRKRPSFAPASSSSCISSGGYAFSCDPNAQRAEISMILGHRAGPLHYSPSFYESRASLRAERTGRAWRDLAGKDLLQGDSRGENGDLTRKMLPLQRRSSYTVGTKRRGSSLVAHSGLQPTVRISREGEKKQYDNLHPLQLSDLDLVEEEKITDPEMAVTPKHQGQSDWETEADTTKQRENVNN